MPGKGKWGEAKAKAKSRSIRARIHCRSVEFTECWDRETMPNELEPSIKVKPRGKRAEPWFIINTGGRAIPGHFSVLTLFFLSRKWTFFHNITPQTPFLSRNWTCASSPKSTFGPELDVPVLAYPCNKLLLAWLFILFLIRWLGFQKRAEPWPLP